MPVVAHNRPRCPIPQSLIFVFLLVVTDSLAAMWEMDKLQVHTTSPLSPAPNSLVDAGSDSALFPQAVIDELVACYASLPKLGQGLKLRSARGPFVLGFSSHSKIH
jgi:hypothetical protein